MTDKIIREEDIRTRVKQQATRMITDNQRSPEENFKKGNSNIKFAALDSISRVCAGEKIANQISLESNPSLSRGIEILAGLIVSPNGGSNITLSFDATIEGGDNNYNKHAVAVCEVLENYFTKEAKIQNTLYDVVLDTIGVSGSHIVAFIPDSNIDTLISKTGLESSVKEISDKLATASLYSDNKKAGKVEVSKDLSILRLREMREELFKERTRHSGAGNELDDTTGTGGINPLTVLRKRRTYKKTPIARMHGAKADEESRHCLEINLPSEAVGPMIFRGNPSEPFGYIVLLDADGYPVTVDAEIDFDKDLRSMGKPKKEEDKLIKRIANNFSTNEKQYNGIDDVYRDFRNYLEADVYASLLDNSYGEKYTLDDDNLLARIAFHRLLRNQKTHILYLPEQLVSYFAYDYDSLGIGRSLVSRTKALSNIYTVLFYANFMGSLSNAIPRKLITIDLDKEDFDKNKRIEEIVNQLIMTQVGSFDFDYRGPSDLMSNLSRYGMQFEFNGLEDADVPAMDIKVTDQKRDIRPIDNTFMELSKDLVTQRIGLSPGVIDQSYQPKFSSEVIRDNELTARQISGYVTKTIDKLSERCVKNVINDPVLLNRCLEVIKGEDANHVLMEILANLIVSTPTTEASGLDTNIDLIQDVVSAVGTIVDGIYPSSYADGISNASSDQFRYFQDTLKGYLLEDYMRRNSSFKGMVDSVIDTDKLKNIFEDASDRKSALLEIFGDYVKDIKKTDDKVEDELSKAGADEPAATPPTTSEPTSTTTDGDSPVTSSEPPEDGEAAEPEDTSSTLPEPPEDTSAEDTIEVPPL